MDEVIIVVISDVFVIDKLTEKSFDIFFKFPFICCFRIKVL